MKGREIVLLILIVAAGVLFHFAHTGKRNLDIHWDGDIFDFREAFTYEESQILDPPIPARIDIRNAHGDVDIQSADRENIQLTFRKKIRRNKEPDARAISDRLKTVITKNGERIAIGVNREDFKRTDFETSLILVIPQKRDVDVRNSYGTVRVTGIRNGSLDNPNGRIVATDVGEELDISNSYEDIEVDNVKSSCRIASKHADVDVRRVGGSLQIDHRYGKVHIEEASGDAVIVGHHTEVSGLRIKGRVEVKTSYENIVLSDVGPVAIQGHHAAVKVSGVSGDLKVTNSYEPVIMSRITGHTISVDGKSTEVLGQSLDAREIRIASSYEKVKLTDFIGQTTVVLSHGDTVLEPASLGYPIEVKNSYSNVRFCWPAGERGPLEARSHGGDIKWKLAESPSINHTNGESLVKAFFDRTDKPAVTLATSYGDIIVEDEHHQE